MPFRLPGNLKTPKTNPPDENIPLDNYTRRLSGGANILTTYSIMITRNQRSLHLHNGTDLHMFNLFYIETNASSSQIWACSKRHIR